MGKNFSFPLCIYKFNISKTNVHTYCFLQSTLRAEYDRSRIFDIRPKPKSSFKKIRPSAEGISRSRRNEISFCSPNSEVECIKYDILDFCNHLLVTANFSFENTRVLLWCISVVTTLQTQNESHFKILWSIHGKNTIYLNLRLE